MTQHKWHKEIHAWADGAEIEVRVSDSNHAYIWVESTEMYPRWDASDTEFRIKPQTVKFSSSGHHFRLKEKKYLYIINNWGSLRLSQDKELLLNEFYVGKIEVQND